MVSTNASSWKGRELLCWLYKVSHSGQSATVSHSPELSVRLQRCTVSANHLHNQEEQGFPLYPLFSSFSPLFMLPPPPFFSFTVSSLSTVITWFSSSYALFPFPLKLYICLNTNPTNHLSAFQFYGLLPILSIGSPVLSNSHRHCNLELEGFHWQLQNRAQVELLVAASGLQSKFANSDSSHILHNGWGDLNIRNTNSWSSCLCILQCKSHQKGRFLHGEWSSLTQSKTKEKNF